jgi:hypothetical protein
MAPISNDNMNAWLTEVLKTDGNDSKMDFWSLCEFAGYDPKVVFRKVWAECRGNPENMKHLRMIIHFGLTRGFGRGKTIQHLVEKTHSPEGKIMLQSAFQIFLIKVGQKKTMDMVTIDRIMGAFPSMTYQAWKGMVSKNQVHDQCDYNGGLPMEFRYPGAAGIMNEELFHTWRGELIRWNGMVQELWSRNRPDNQRKTDEETANYIDIQFHQSILPLNARERFWELERRNNLEEEVSREIGRPTEEKHDPLYDDDIPPSHRSAVSKRGSPSGSKQK